MRKHAVVAELAYALDSGSSPHFVGSGSSPVNCTLYGYQIMTWLMMSLSDFFCFEQKDSPAHL